MQKAVRRVSRDFIVGVKLAQEPAYRIAKRAGIHPVTLSKLVTGYLEPAPDDHRVLAVAKVLGLPPEGCFETVREDLAA